MFSTKQIQNEIEGVINYATGRWRNDQWWATI